MKQLMKRNLLLYFRDRVSVFFSLLAVMITFILYIVVFRNLYSNSLYGDIFNVVDVWAVCGIVVVPTVTTPLGSLWIWVDDRKNKLYQDFYASPVKRWKLTGGYMLSSFTVGLIMSTILLVVTQIFLVITGVGLFSWQQYLQAFIVIILSTFSGAGLTLFLVGLFSSSSAFSGFSLVIGTLMGFVCGNYTPIGMLPDAAQTFIKLCPAAHSAALLRQIFLGEAMYDMVPGAPQDFFDVNMIYLGIKFEWGSEIMAPWVHIAMLAVSGVIFYALAIPVCSRKRIK